MAKRSAGILLYRRRAAAVELLLVHPGGPFWARKDIWSIPKGEYEHGQDPLAAARREFAEETGAALPGDALPLGEVVQRGGKVVTGFAVEGDFDPVQLCSNRFELEWPPRSGRMASFPEVDRAEWFPVAQARAKIIPAQAAFIDRLLAALGPRP
jgi:predicted NUDIX family NTP pyrophosphohydrolase